MWTPTCGRVVVRVIRAQPEKRDLPRGGEAVPHVVRELVLELEEAQDVEAVDEARRLSQQLPPEGVDEAREAVVRRIVQDDDDG